MKVSQKKTLEIKAVFDASECILVNKGGSLAIDLKSEVLYDDDDGQVSLNEFLDTFDVVKVVFQLDPSQKGHFDWIRSEACAHKTRTENEEKNDTL
jgi:hypothetical protein